MSEVRTIRATVSLTPASLPEPDWETGTVWAEETEPGQYVAHIPAGFPLQVVITPTEWGGTMPSLTVGFAED